jgi:hypothetical protein
VRGEAARTVGSRSGFVGSDLAARVVSHHPTPRASPATMTPGREVTVMSILLLRRAEAHLARGVSRKATAWPSSRAL